MNKYDVGGNTRRYSGPACLHVTPVEADLIRRALAHIQFGADADMADALRHRIRQYLQNLDTERVTRNG